MSFNQSRSDRNETQYRKTGRSASSNQQRTSSSSYGKGAGGGPAPSPSINSSSSISSNRSFKKSHNAQGGQSRVNAPVAHSSDSTSGTRNAQNGAHLQPQLHGASDAPVGSGAAKPVESSTSQRGIRAVPKAPTSQSASVNSDSSAPAKVSGDSSKGYQFQFGSIGMQIPARTSSAPPNLDEQKRDQAWHDSYRAVANMPTPSVPKQELPRKDMGAVDHSNTGESQQMQKVKKDSQVLHTTVSHSPNVSQTQKHSALPIPMTSMQMPFHQPQVSLQFGGPNPQMQSQGVTASSIPMPMPIPLPMGSAPQVQQHMFVPGLQPHPMQPQGIMHQGQGLNFTAQMGPPQLSPQMGNMGMGMTPQYPQQQGGKFGGPRKTVVKITDPDTHKEVRLDKRTDTYADGGGSAPRSHHNAPQSMPIPSFASAHPINFYPNSYNGSSMYFAAPSSLPLTSNQMTPNAQAPRFSYPVGQGPQNVSFMNPSALNTLQVNKTGPQNPGASELPNVEHSSDVHKTLSSASSGGVQVTVKPATSAGEKVSEASLSDSSSKVGSPKTSRVTGGASSSHPQRDSETLSGKNLQQIKPSSESSISKSPVVATKQSAAGAAVSAEIVASDSLSSGSASLSEESVSAPTNTDGRMKEPLSRSNSIKDNQKKQGKKGQSQPQQQVGGKYTPSSTLAWRTLDSGISSSIEVSETVEGKPTLPAALTGEAGVPGTKVLLSTVDAPTSNTSEAKTDSSLPGSNTASEVSGAGVSVDTDSVCNSKLEPDRPSTSEGIIEEQRGEILPERPKQGSNVFEMSSESVSKGAASSKEVPGKGTSAEGLEEPTPSNIVVDRGSDNVKLSDSGIRNSTDVESLPVDKTSNVDALYNRSDTPDLQSSQVSSPDLSETIVKNEGESTEKFGGGWASNSVSGSKDKPATELVRSKSMASKGKKKRKEILSKADAAGTTSDLYNAYKGPQEKKEIAVSSESSEKTSAAVNSKQEHADAIHLDDAVSEKSVQSKTEPDDWEDAAEISTPKLEPSDKDHASGRSMHGGNMKKYSRDFLLKFAEQCTSPPEGFEIASDIADVVMSTHVNASHLVDRDSYPSPGRMDRQSGGPRMDRRGSVIVDDDRWNRMPGPSNSGRDLRMDVGFGSNVGFRPGQGGNYGVLRNPRAQMPMPYGILSGPMQAMGPQGGMQRNSPDADRWQRATNFQQKGLFPPPNAPLQMMHKAERKYEVGKVTDEEQAKQRQLKAILNKLTPQNFEKLFEQVKAVNIENAATLKGVISQIFDKALMEPTFCEMYANFCYYLSGELPDFSEDNEKITFKRLLLNKCQEEFERGEREQEEANKAGKEGEVQQSEEEREEKRVKARRRMLGNIRLIGELYKKKMLTERIMHECIKKLLGQYENPDEEDVEALCKLMSTIGEMIDHPKAKEHMDAYFDRMAKLSNNMKLSSRVRFMLKDAIELRKNKWQQRRKVEGPKKIEEVHRDAAQERQLQTSRLSRGPSMNASARRGAMDFVPRGMLSSPTTQMGSFRGMPSPGRGYVGQDVRSDDRQSYDARTLSAHRPIGDESITLGPQGGLGRGLSRGSPGMSNAPLADIPGGAGDSRRTAVGLNGYSTFPDRGAYGSREDLAPRYIPDRRGPPAFDHPTAQEHIRVRTPPDRGYDRPHATSPSRSQGPGTAIVPPEKVLSEERLREMSMAAIKEFYSARDEKEVALCIKDLNSPSFHPSMVSLWVTDSFERRDMERDILAKLLVNLSKSRDSTLSPVELVKGFESVLMNLEDAVNDAPKAAEFLGRIFGKVVVENVVPLKEIGMLLKEGGEEPGRLLEIGLAGDVLGSTLEIIKLDKGETLLQEIRTSSNLRLEDFCPPDPNRSKLLEKFI